MKPNGESIQDILSIAFGYIPADCEETYVAVEFLINKTYTQSGMPELKKWHSAKK